MTRRSDTALGLGVLALAVAGLFGVLAWREAQFGPRGEPLTPYAVIALTTPAYAKASAAPLGGRISPEGRLTILEAPGTAGVAEARAGKGAVTDEMPRDSQPVPNAMLAGIRGLFTLGPEPLEAGERLMTLDLPEPMRGRLLLVNGCFRFGSVDGPAAVFPFGSVLGLVEGRLVVGPPGLAAATSAQVGEVIAWPGRIGRPISAEGQAKVQRLCRSNEVLAVVPASESVAETRYASDLAERWAAKRDLRFGEAMAATRQCLEQVRRAGRYEPGTPCELLVPAAPPPAPPAPPPPFPPPPQPR
nr:hypothetical protein [uncultured Sphingomonas sp.]